jgi:hypothetical protein
MLKILKRNENAEVHFYIELIDVIIFLVVFDIK